MQSLNRVHLGGLRAIEAVGRLGSLAAAADEMGVTVGAVSQKVRKAEQQLGRPLFERRPSGLAPTALGAEVVRLLASGMSDLAAAVDLVGRETHDSLTVSVAPVFAEKWLVWRLQDFHDAHPGIPIRVDATIDVVDPNASDVDMCIRAGGGAWPGVEAHKLLDQRVFPVCSTALAERLATPADLADVPIIRDPGAMFGWDVWLEPNGLDEGVLGDGPTFSNASLCLDAAMTGQGVFLAWETLAGDALMSGRLAAPFRDHHASGVGYWLVVPRHARQPKAVQAFETWLREELTAHAERTRDMSRFS